MLQLHVRVNTVNNSKQIKYLYKTHYFNTMLVKVHTVSNHLSIIITFVTTILSTQIYWNLEDLKFIEIYEYK